MSSIEHIKAAQGLEPGALIALYTLDLTPLGAADIFHWCPNGPATFQGITYAAFDIEADGFEWTGQGAIPQPKLRISNADRAIGAVAKLYQDLVGAKVTRLRTYTQFLDNAASADPDAYFAPDQYVIEQKSSHTKFQIEWALSAAMDQQGRQIPGRLLLRNLCLWRYRVWNPEAIPPAFDYSHVTCPYVGSAYFDINGNPVSDPGLDTPSKQVDTCCKVRFGAHNTLPFGGFPGVALTQV